MDLGLTDRVFVVTAGSRGLGFAGAKALVNEGAKVVVAGRDEEVLAQAVKQLGGYDNAVGLSGDLNDSTTSEQLTATAVARYGRLDGCLISTGGPAPGGILGTAEEDWRDAFESVLLGSLRVARAVAAAIDQPHDGVSGHGGAMLFVLSTSVRTPLAGLAVSNALRPGMAGMVKDLADALGPRGVRVNGVMPGKIATDRVFALDARFGSPERTRIRNETTIPLGRYGEPAEFGDLAAYLLSPRASYITGTVIAIDGGATRAI